MNKSDLWVYDIETYPNVFTLAIGNMQTRKMTVFEISSRKDEREKMFEYLDDVRKRGGYMVGFNNVGFDYPVVHYILSNQKCSVLDVYHKAMSIIKSDDRFGSIVRDKDCYVKQIDLYKIHHFDNAARATSLKMLEFNMRMDNIEDLPFDVGVCLIDDQIDILIKYNAHDVKATAMFLEKSLNQIEFRVGLGELYGKNMLNFNDTKIGKDHFVTELEKQNEGCCYKRVGGQRMMMQTKRDKIDLNDCIFDYVKFDRPEFDAVLQWFKSKTITETKGVFTDILESELGDVAKYAVLKKKRIKQFSKPSQSQIEALKQKYPMGWLSEEQLKSGKVSYWWNWNVAESLNVVVDGLEYVFGTGGIHASVEAQVVDSDDDWLIIDRDVSSFYPNLAISNRIFPEHLGEQFCDIYKDIYEQRKKTKKGSNENAALKLALNGAYGASNDQFSPLYDPKFTMAITINGQLSLCMLAEKLLTVDGLQIIQCNTDGLTYRCKRSDVVLTDEICKDWEKTTRLEIETVVYSKMAIADVNNYIAVKEDSGVKTKGRFVYEGLGWHQNQSNLVIKRAAVNYLVHGIPVEKTIRECTDKFDFMARTKVPRSSKLMMIREDGVEIQLQNICRYFVAIGGGELVKVMPPLDKPEVWTVLEKDGDVVEVKAKTDIDKYKRKGYEIFRTIDKPSPERRIGINAGVSVIDCSDVKNFDWSLVDCDWYIDQAKKLVAFELDDE